MFAVRDTNERRELRQLRHDDDHFVAAQQERRRRLQRVWSLLQTSQRMYTSATNTYVITTAIRLLYDYDTTTIRLRRIARACFQFDASKK